MPYILLTFIGTIYEFVFTICLQISHDMWWQLYTLMELLALSWFFYYSLAKLYRIYIVIASALFSALWVYFTIIRREGVGSDLYLAAPETVIILSGAIFWFSDLFKKADVVLFRSPAFYFVSGVTFYYATSMFFFMIFSEMDNADPALEARVWIVQASAAMILRILIGVSVWVAKKI